MADDSRLRSPRPEAFAASGAAHERGGAASGADPLAELARLIGQDDLFKQMRVDAARAGSEDTYAAPPQPMRERMDRGPSPLREMAAARQELYAPGQEDIDNYQRDYAPPPRAPQSQPLAEPRDYYPPAPATADYRHPAHPSFGPAAYAPEGYSPQAYAAEPVADYSEWDRNGRLEPEYAAEDQEAFEEVAPREKRRGGMIIVASVVGVALIGTAGAFAYRAMTGGGDGAQPPVIKAEQGPAKVVPPPSAPTGAARTTYDRAGGGKDVNLVPREEQPVEIKDARPSGPKMIGPTGAGPGLAGNPAVGSGATASVPLTAPNPNEPKKVKTIAIRPDGSVAPEPTGNRAQPNAGGPNRPGAPAQPNPNRAPGSRTGPQSQIEEPVRPPAAVPVRTASIPSAANPLPAMASTPATGNFVVQLTSQKTENDAQASFRALQAKYPSVLAGRQPVIRRADLGDRGTYYRAQVGPFQTAEQANDLCGNLKAAGGQCIVQRN